MQLKKQRDLARMIYIEGETLVHDLIKEFPHLIVELILSEDKQEAFTSYQHPCSIATQKDLDKLTQLKTAKMVNAVISYPTPRPWKEGQKAILLDQIQDPGNLGTIIRTADWFGIEHIFCAPNTTDYLNPKVIHASMASAFRVNMHYQDLAPIIKAQQHVTYGAFMDGEDFQNIAPSQIDFLVLGHEGRGISPELSALLTKRIGIPSKGKAESLNVAVAAGILIQHLSK